MTEGSSRPLQQAEITLKDFLRIISARRWWLIAFATLITGSAALYNFRLPNVYRAAAKVQINREAPQVVDVKEPLTAQAQASEFLKTQHKVLASRTLAERVIKKLALDKNREITGEGAPPGFFDSLLGGEKAEKSPGAAPDLVEAYYRHVAVTPVPFTLLVEISATFTNRLLVAQVANAHAEAYVEHCREQRLDATGEASDWLIKQSEELKQKLEKSQAALQAYREKIGTVSLDDNQNIVVQKLKQLNEEVTAAKNQRFVAENNFSQIKALREKGGDPLTLPSLLQNGVVQDLKKQITEKTAQVSKLQERYLDKHPALIQAKSELEGVQRQLGSEVEKLQASVENDYRLALSREKNLEDALKEQEKLAMELNQRQIAYENLKRQVESDRQLFESILVRVNQTGMTKKLDTSNVSILDGAVEPSRKYRPHRGLNIALAFAVSLALGCAFCLVLESLTETVREPSDLGFGDHVPFLGYIPHRSRSLTRRPTAIAAAGPDSFEAEPFRTAASVLCLRPETAAASVFLVTSALPGEGKTTCAINLAASFADRNHRTLLIEADLRRPSIARALGLGTYGGLEALVSGRLGGNGTVLATSHSNLWVVACAAPSPQAHGVFELPLVRDFIQETRKIFDRVVIDTPPVGTVGDALSICQLADGVVWVVRFNKSRRKVVQDAFHRLMTVKPVVAGLIINDVNFTSGHNKYYYAYGGYDSYYGKRKKG